MKDIFGTRVAVTTGAGSGIGRALALDLRRRGGAEAIRQEMLHDGYAVEVTVVHPGGVATRIASRRAAEIDTLPPEKQAAARHRL